MVNKAIIIGNLGADPETRHTSGGQQVASFSVATTERWKGQDGKTQEATEWHQCKHKMHNKKTIFALMFRATICSI